MATLSIGAAWDEAKTALRSKRRLLVPVALGLILLPAVIVAMVEPQAAAGEQPPPGAWMIVAIAMILVMVVGQIAILLLINGWRGSVGEAIGKAARRTPTFIIAALALFLPLILIFSFMLAFAGAGGIEQGRVQLTQMSGGGVVIMLLGLFALIYVSIRLMPLIAVVAMERLGAIASLRRALALTSGQFWRLLGFLIMLLIGFLVVALMVGAVVGSLVTLLLGSPEPWSLAQLAIALAGGLIQTGFVLVYVAMLARIYAQLAPAAPSVPDVSRESD